jgi:hypothetical protein
VHESINRDTSHSRVLHDDQTIFVCKLEKLLQRLGMYVLTEIDRELDRIAGKLLCHRDPRADQHLAAIEARMKSREEGGPRRGQFIWLEEIIGDHS